LFSTLARQSFLLCTVTDIADGKAVLDANHPLAGLALIFSCTVQDVRAATAEELAGVQRSWSLIGDNLRAAAAFKGVIQHHPEHQMGMVI
jgi:FKBP-type peptidyl-prolyl cis-trans isomerase 2